MAACRAARHLRDGSGAAVRAFPAGAHRRAAAVALRATLAARRARRHEAARPVDLQRAARGRRPCDADLARPGRRAPPQRSRRGVARRGVRGERRPGVQRQPRARCCGRRRRQRLRAHRRARRAARGCAFHGRGRVRLGALATRDVRVPDRARARGARRVPRRGSRRACAHLPGPRCRARAGAGGESGAAGES